MLVRVKVEIGKLVFNSVVSVERRKDLNRFTETAIIELPKKLRFKSNGSTDSIYDPKKRIEDYIKVGDKVSIWMGYDQHLLKRFEGYVSQSVQNKIPLTVECECEMWKLKRQNTNVSIENTSIKQIVQTIAPDYEIDVLDAEIGAFSMKNTTPVKVLAELKKRYGLYSYFVNKTLVVGKPFTNKEVINLPMKVFDFSKHIISHNLEYKEVEDIKIKIKAISINPDNSKIEVIVGDKNGGIRTLHFFDKKESELKKLATSYLDKFKVSGYTGSFTNFGFPILEVGQRLRIFDPYNNQSSEHYATEIIESIKNGYRLKVTIGKRVL
jgi:hypothetical protein